MRIEDVALKRLTKVEQEQIRRRAALHQRNLAEIKSGTVRNKHWKTLDNTAPLPVKLDAAKKRQQKREEEKRFREREIRRENVRLLDRMARILEHETNLNSQTKKKVTFGSKDARKKQRSIELDRILEENAQLSDRIINAKPVYSLKEWRNDRKVKEHYIKNLRVFANDEDRKQQKNKDVAISRPPNHTSSLKVPQKPIGKQTRPRPPPTIRPRHLQEKDPVDGLYELTDSMGFDDKELEMAEKMLADMKARPMRSGQLPKKCTKKMKRKPKGRLKTNSLWKSTIVVVKKGRILDGEPAFIRSTFVARGNEVNIAVAASNGNKRGIWSVPKGQVPKNDISNFLVFCAENLILDGKSAFLKLPQRNSMLQLPPSTL